MSTNSTIAVVRNGEVESVIYCHWDGYPEGVGKILLQHYDTTEKVRELMKLGNLSSLGKRIAPSDGEEHTFEQPAEGVCVAYHRDRGDEWDGGESYGLQEFNYRWDIHKEMWFVSKGGRRWSPLLMAKDKA